MNKYDSIVPDYNVPKMKCKGCEKPLGYGKLFQELKLELIKERPKVSYSLSYFDYYHRSCWVNKLVRFFNWFRRR